MAAHLQAYLDASSYKPHSNELLYMGLRTPVVLNLNDKSFDFFDVSFDNSSY
jgi:hypothetical protein